MSIFNFFRKKAPPLRPTAGRPTPSAKYEEVDAGQAADFLENGLAIQVHSSCIRWTQWDKTTGGFMVEFIDQGKATGTYVFRNVPRAMAEDFLGAGSKGSWVSLRLVHAKWPFDKVG